MAKKIFLILCLYLSDIEASFNFLVPQKESKCPEKYLYQIDEKGQLFGALNLKEFGNEEVSIHVELFLRDSIDKTAGKIEKLTGKTFKVNFPTWKNISPQIAIILVNDKLICTDLANYDEESELIIIEGSFNITDDSKEAPLQVLPLEITEDNQLSNDKMYGVFEMYQQFNTADNKVVNVKNKIRFKPKMPKKPNRNYPLFERRIPYKYKQPVVMKNPSFNLRGSPGKNDIVKPVPEGFGEVTTTPYSEVCGKPITTNSLIVSGFSIPKGAYPWLVAIFRVQTTGLNYICSGSLISNKHIVTAAHCLFKDNRVSKPDDFLVILGKLNIAKWTPTPGEVILDASKLHVHPDYNPATSDADIAVIELSETIHFTAFVRPICLWSNNDDLNKIVGDQGTVAGWGKNEKGHTSPEPKQTWLPVVDQETCLRSAHEFAYITSERTFCAGMRDGSGPCNGDSGSGFILKKDGVWMLRGIVSMSLSDIKARTCDLRHYIVFTDASKFNRWLLGFVLNKE
ncbi:unnamed protein product [Brassicogethes aeneus]|uniref:Peptidase S1 domain-containing protein n=1 Tax=Brassicogethes aeneus TaxID=1431903 RepID=A0A9P0AZG6_BRAAE|nr:unnamed protein product [Brassicogethes aeneus]